jgi:hypothetical protein
MGKGLRCIELVQFFYVSTPVNKCFVNTQLREVLQPARLQMINRDPAPGVSSLCHQTKEKNNYTINQTSQKMKNLLTSAVATLALAATVFTASAQNSSNPITGNSTTLQLTPSTSAQIVDNNIALDANSTYTGATVSIASGMQSGDALAYGTLPAGVTGSYNSTTGVLTFSGSTSAANYQALLRTVTLTSSATGGTAKSISFSVGSALNYSANGHYYQFISGSFTWQAAKAAAAAKTLYGMQGYLATVTSQGENDFIQQKLQADGWIGASDDYSHINIAKGTTYYANQTAAEGHWFWVTGPEKGTAISNTTYSQYFYYGSNAPVLAGPYMNWNGGEPNNYANGENSGEIYSSGGSAGRWNDLDSSNTLGYVVEFGGMAGDPTVSLTFSRSVQYVSTAVNGTNPTKAYSSSTGGRQVVDNTITVTGASSVTNASVSITSGRSAGDTLSFSTAALPSGVTGSYNAATGVLSFTGTATPAQWQALLRTVMYSRSNTISSNRQISFTAGNSAAYTKTLTNTGFALGLTWVSVDATVSGSNVIIDWKTADEKNTASFDIEHSTDGRSFTKIGSLDAKGSGNNAYTFTDNNAADGANYYRLKQIDNDGTFQYSKALTANIRRDAAAVEISVYPNPAVDAIRFNTNETVNVEIYSMSGAKVIAQQADATTAVSVSNLPSGYYVYRLSMQNGTVQNGKIQLVH